MEGRRVNGAGSYHVTASTAIGRRTRTQQRAQKPGLFADTSPVFEFICLSPRKSSATAPRSSAESVANLLRHLDCNSDESKRARRKPSNYSSSPVNRVSAGAKKVIRWYLEKVKPLYEKLSISQHQHHRQKISGPADSNHESPPSINWSKENLTDRKSFSGNFRYPRSRISSSCISSSTSSMVLEQMVQHTRRRIWCLDSGFEGSVSDPKVLSPRHGRSGSGSGYGIRKTDQVGVFVKNSDASMEEVQLAIQGAIAHCKNSTSKV